MFEDDKLKPDEFLSRCEWQGGILEGLIYGLNANDLDQTDPDFRKEIEHLTQKFDELLDEIDEFRLRYYEKYSIKPDEEYE
jgi:hypothetical protein